MISMWKLDKGGSFTGLTPLLLLGEVLKGRFTWHSGNIFTLNCQSFSYGSLVTHASTPQGAITEDAHGWPFLQVGSMYHTIKLELMSYSLALIQANSGAVSSQLLDDQWFHQWCFVMVDYDSVIQNGQEDPMAAFLSCHYLVPIEREMAEF